jgi:hypothetical protein
VGKVGGGVAAVVGGVVDTLVWIENAMARLFVQVVEAGLEEMSLLLVSFDCRSKQTRLKRIQIHYQIWKTYLMNHHRNEKTCQPIHHIFGSRHRRLDELFQSHCNIFSSQNQHGCGRFFQG